MEVRREDREIDVDDEDRRRLKREGQRVFVAVMDGCGARQGITFVRSGIDQSAARIRDLAHF